MKTTKLMAIALCAAACSTTTAFAEDDLIVSATPEAVIADPVNPQPGMVFRGYDRRFMGDLLEFASSLDKIATVKTTVVADEKFDYGKFKDVEISQGVWEGFLNCKRSANCTILVQQASYNGCGYALFVNGKKFLCGHGQASGMIDLKAGYNHIRLIAQNAGGNPVAIFLKATDSTKDPKPLTPKNMAYDEKPDEGDVF